jgi:hypothetical protein
MKSLSVFLNLVLACSVCACRGWINRQLRATRPLLSACPSQEGAQVSLDDGVAA